MPGSCSSWTPYGRRRGECAGVARGVWSGVGDRESWEKVGEEGAVDKGELGRERFAMRRRDGSSSSCEWDRDMDWE